MSRQTLAFWIWHVLHFWTRNQILSTNTTAAIATAALFVSAPDDLKIIAFMKLKACLGTLLSTVKVKKHDAFALIQ